MLERNPTYFREGQPAAGQARVPAAWTRARQALEQLQAGQVDLVSFLHAEQAQAPGHGDASRWSPAPRPPPPSWASTCASRPSTTCGCGRRCAPGWTSPRPGGALPPGRADGDARSRRRSCSRTPTPAAPPGPDVARAELLLREAGVRKVPLTIYYPAGRDTSAEDQVLFQPLIEAGLLELQHVELAPQEYTTSAARGPHPRLPHAVDRRLPGPGQLPLLPAQLERADHLPARLPQPGAGQADGRGARVHRSGAALPALPARGGDLRAGLPAHPAVPRPQLRRGDARRCRACGCT